MAAAKCERLKKARLLDRRAARQPPAGGGAGQLLIGMSGHRGWVGVVIDQDGLNGYYDFSFTPPSTNLFNRLSPENDDAPPFVQIGEQLGLRFEPTKVPTEIRHCLR